MKLYISILLIFFCFTQIFSQRKVNVKQLRSKFVLSKSRVSFKNELKKTFKQTFATELNSKTEKLWKEAFYKAENAYFKSAAIYSALKTALNDYQNRRSKFIYAAIETSSSLYPNSFSDEINKIFEVTNNAKVFCIAANYLIHNNYSKRTSKFYVKEITKRFKRWELNPTLKIFHEFLLHPKKDRLKKIPSLVDLLKYPVQKNKTIIYTFFRNDRNFPGITVIKSPTGKFLRTKSDSIFHIEQLGISLANLPGYLSDGNTPEGIFSIVGWYITPTESIGPTPNVLTRLPFEVSPQIYYHNQEIKKWKIEDYKHLLPQSWQNYFPLQEAFYAGKSGRKLLIMHGSTDDLTFYKNQPYYPHTPTQGCVSSIELWDESTGKCIRSDQAKLMNAFFSTGVFEGFLIVVNIDDKKAPVTLNEIKDLILEAEKTK